MPTEQEKKEAHEKISKLTDTAMKCIREAEEIAKKANVSFGFDVAYGMGGTFNVGAYDSDEYQDDPGTDGGWYASSQSC